MGGCQPLNLRQNLLFGKVFAENCMKMNEIEPRGGCMFLVPLPLHPPMDLVLIFVETKQTFLLGI